MQIPRSPSSPSRDGPRLCHVRAAAQRKDVVLAAVKRNRRRAPSAADARPCCATPRRRCREEDMVVLEGYDEHCCRLCWACNVLLLNHIGESAGRRRRAGRWGAVRHARLGIYRALGGAMHDRRRRLGLHRGLKPFQARRAAAAYTELRSPLPPRDAGDTFSAFFWRFRTGGGALRRRSRRPSSSPSRQVGPQPASTAAWRTAIVWGGGDAAASIARRGAGAGSRCSTPGVLAATAAAFLAAATPPAARGRPSFSCRKSSFQPHLLFVVVVVRRI